MTLFSKKAALQALCLFALARSADGLFGIAAIISAVKSVALVMATPGAKCSACWFSCLMADSVISCPTMCAPLCAALP